ALLPARGSVPSRADPGFGWTPRQQEAGGVPASGIGVRAGLAGAPAAGHFPPGEVAAPTCFLLSDAGRPSRSCRRCAGALDLHAAGIAPWTPRRRAPDR